MSDLQSHILNVSLTGVEHESADTAGQIVKWKSKGRKGHKGEFERVMGKPYNAHLPTEVEKSANTAAPTDKPKRKTVSKRTRQVKICTSLSWCEKH